MLLVQSGSNEGISAQKGRNRGVSKYTFVYRKVLADILFELFE